MMNNTPSGVKMQGTSNQPLKNYMASLNTISSLVCIRTNHLAIKRKLLLKIGELEIWLLCMHGDRGVCHPLLTWCLNRAWSMILQPILHTCTEEACEDRLFCGGKIQLKHMHLLLKE